MISSLFFQIFFIKTTLLASLWGVLLTFPFVAAQLESMFAQAISWKC